MPRPLKSDVNVEEYRLLRMKSTVWDAVPV
jgi:hypothetical protein